ncbi:hypothetical protein DES47_105482 [Roseateles toxinivorans]|uniref:Uncharacterized protein n=2 Tax=Roseateles toxinivorans TaxID=270368 RepID=A0A4R6QKA3_9BURK|nr:hypothetical protein DES47_105482 [Roseateles toxinivorans]
MTPSMAICLALLLLYIAFVVWYGGRGRPLTAAEIEAYVAELETLATEANKQDLLASVRALLAQDDGREFVMQNLVRYRAKALYPPGHEQLGDDPRAADRRYGKAIIPHLLRYGNVPVFIARRSGSFIEPARADAWHYVAMVRYRSRRDFLRFAISIERAADIAVHKWAAIEKTHIFPLRPIVSLIFVRGAVGALLALIGALAVLLLH